MTKMGIEVQTMEDRQGYLLVCSACRRTIAKVEHPKMFTTGERIRVVKAHICVSENRQGFEEELRHG